MGITQWQIIRCDNINCSNKEKTIGGKADAINTVRSKGWLCRFTPANYEKGTYPKYKFYCPDCRHIFDRRRNKIERR